MSSAQPNPIIIPPEVEAEMTPAVRAFVDMLLDRIAKLEARLGLNPQNSSLPPSTQHPHAKPPPKKNKGKRKKRGGQPGHPRHQRDLIPSEECNAVIPLKPTTCRRCAAKLTGTDPEPLRHQVWELPEIKPLVTEYQQHRLECPCCGESTCAVLPESVPTGQSGPRLIAFAGLLMAYFRQSKRRTALFLHDLLGQPCCPSLTVKMEKQVAQALAAPYQELQQALAEQPQVHMDESPTKEANQKAWLWTAVAPLFAVFAIYSSRAGTAVGNDGAHTRFDNGFHALHACFRCAACKRGKSEAGANEGCRRGGSDPQFGSATLKAWQRNLRYALSVSAIRTLCLSLFPSPWFQPTFRCIEGIPARGKRLSANTTVRMALERSVNVPEWLTSGSTTPLSGTGTSPPDTASNQPTCPTVCSAHATPR